MINNCVKPFFKNENVKCTVLAMDIINKEQYLNPNIVKIVSDINDQVLYTSRSPIPYSKKFTKKTKRGNMVFLPLNGFLKTLVRLKSHF